MDVAARIASIDARLDRLPPSRPVWSWIARVSFGAFFEIYEVTLTGLMGPLLVKAGIFHPRDGFLGLPDLATFALATFGGLFVGVLLFAVVTDRFGRRPVFTWSLAAYAAATLVMAMQDTAGAICLWRFVAAIGIGAEVVAVDAYLAELAPAGMRGRGFALAKSLQYAAVPVAAALAALAAGAAPGGIAGWRLILLVPVIGAVLVWRVRRGLSESPRWLAHHGRETEAARIVAAAEDAIRRNGRPLPDPVIASTRLPCRPGRICSGHRCADGWR